MSKSFLTLYSAWQCQPDGEMDPLGCTEYPRKQTAISEMQKLLKQYPGACLVKTVRSVMPDEQEGR